MSIGTIILIILVLALVGVLPTWGHSSSWGYGPSGGVGTIVVILLILVVMERFELGQRTREHFREMQRRARPGPRSAPGRKIRWRR